MMKIQGSLSKESLGKIPFIRFFSGLFILIVYLNIVSLFVSSYSNICFVVG